ncbi:MAG TPA: hypothetical protein VFT91_07735, partial [Dehalococcoidia bacterium]|nr:hypothetical protein [Dehalococcoidia bacterium]
MLALGGGAARTAPTDAAGKIPLYRAEVTESFTCKDTDFCDAIFETAGFNHESAVLFSDGTAHEEFAIQCRAAIPGICEAGTAQHIVEDFSWFAAPAECDEFGCTPVFGDCVPNPPFLTCVPFFWRDAPDTWTFIGCAELAADSFFTCARRGSPPVTLTDPFELFGGTYPDDTFWPAVPGHYTFASPEQFGPDVCFF